MDVYQVLKQDHQNVRQIFQKIEQTASDKVREREQLFDQLRTELIAHSHAEQRIFYSKLHDQPPTHDIVEDGIHEHEEVEKMLSKLDNIPADSDEWMSRLGELKKAVEHHVQEEEQKMFPESHKLIGENTAETLAEEVQKAKAEEEQKLH